MFTEDGEMPLSDGNLEETLFNIRQAKAINAVKLMQKYHSKTEIVS